MKKRKTILISFLLVLLASIGVGRWCLERKPLFGVPVTIAKKTDYYYCAMHPWFHQDHPGNCGICGMTLIKKEGGAANGTDAVSAGPAQVPEALKGLAPVDLSPFKQQLIGIRTAVVEDKPVIRVIRTVGQYARGQAASAKGRYAVADIYALDIPYVKVGQKARISTFSGSGPELEGRVSRIYPRDGTQSHVRRVQISISHAPASELFSNVEIEADSQPLLSVPAEAVMSTGLHHYVFVKKSDEIFAPREITVGFEGDDQWQVLSGLNAGETVVEGANFMVDADSKLEANFAAMEAQTK
jgi:hypothetical protein